ncbi:MAG: rhodanese-like domain-containing protein [Vibrio sp.]
MKRSQKQLSTLAILIGMSFPTWATTFNQLLDMPSDSTQVVDCRPSNVYNGWADEANNAKGGHYPNASNIEPSWLQDMKQEQQDVLFAVNQLDKQQPTYVYCDKAQQDKMVKLLKKAGFAKVEGLSQTINHYEGKLDSLANYQDLVPVSWVKDLLDKKTVQNPPKGDVKIVEVAWGPAVKYLVSHIPSALYLNTNDLESEPLWNKVSDEILTKTISDLGITKDSTVVLYGRDQLAASRAANLLMYAGVEDVRLVNGGWQAWEAADYPTEALKNTAEPVEFGAKIPVHPEYITSMDKARKILADQENSSLVSVRTWAEYIGETSGYDYIKPKGRITGSKWGHAGSDSYHLEDYLNPDNTMASEKIISHFLNEWNINGDQDVAFYCGTGWRASEAFFYTHVMGWKNVSVFDGGWYEWSMDPKNPVETGDNVKKPTKG